MSYKLTKGISEESYSRSSVSSVTSSRISSSVVDSSDNLSTTRRLVSIEDDDMDSMFNRSSALARTDDISSSIRRSMRSAFDDDDDSIIRSSQSSMSVQKDDNSFSMEKSKLESAFKEDDTSKMSATRSSHSAVSVKSNESGDSSYSKSSKSVSSVSESYSSEVSEKPPELYIAIMDYNPRPGDTEGIRLKEGQEVEVVDSSRAHKWRVKTKIGSTSVTREGMVPSCYLEKKTISVSQETTEIRTDPKTLELISRRERVVKELVETEDDFARDMQYVCNNYLKEMENKELPKELRSQKNTVFSNFKAISDFHNNVLMKGVQYYATEPAKLGKTFLRLERDFDMHVSYCRDESKAQEALESGPLREYFDEFSKKLKDDKSLSEHLKLPIQRINDYQLLLKELIKYTARLKEETIDLEKAYEFMQGIPQRIADLKYLNYMQGYRGNLHKLGRILRTDWFEVLDPKGLRRERFAFLFKGRLFITDVKKVTLDKSIYLVKYIVKFQDVEIIDNADDDELKLRIQSLKKGTEGYPLTLKARNIEHKESWLKEVTTTAIPQGVEDLGEDEPELIHEEVKSPEPDQKKPRIDRVESEETTEVKIQSETDGRVEILEDYEAYEEMNTVITESMRSGSLTSLDEFHSALDDEPSLCLTASEMEGGPGKPRFVSPLKGVKCKKGDFAILECEIAATPPPSVNWMKDNELVIGSDKITAVSDDPKYSLTIKDASIEDSGFYSIIASNFNGTATCAATFNVLGGEVARPSTPGGTTLPFAAAFTEKLKDTELIEGSSVRLSVSVESNPEAKVIFYKDDQELKQDDRIKVVSESKGTYELVMNTVISEDTGKYSCVAINSEGRDVTTSSITVSRGIQQLVKEPEPCVITATLSDVKVSEGASAMLELKATGYPRPKITWFKDDKEITAGERYRFLYEGDDSYTLVIKNVKKGDTGKYVAIAKNPLTEATTSCQLIVTSPASFRKQMKDMAVMTDSPAKFEVEVEGAPAPEIKWLKDGQQVKESERIKMLQEDQIHSLLIEKVKVEDSGNYCCVITNETGTQTGFGALVVNSPPTVVREMNNVECKEKETISFTIKISGLPKPTIKWLKDNSELKIDETHIKVVEEETSSYTLTVDKVTKKDVGTYTCKITNDFGTTTSSGTLGVSDESTSPTFTQSMKDVETSENQDAKFTIKIAGKPKPSIKWTKDDAELTIDGKHVKVIEEASDSYTLIIEKVTKEDGGSYGCTITNESGKESSKAKLKVKDTTSPPGFVQNMKDVESTENEDVSFTVKISGNPKPKIKWTKDGAELVIDNKHTKVKEEASDTFTLIIQKVVKEDGGKYSCEITNEHGKETSSGKLNVKVTTAPPSFTQTMKDVETTESQDVSFTVKIAGNPKPNVKWTKDDAELTIDNKHVKVKEEASDTLTLIIQKVIKDDGGKYSCKITNEHGTESTSAKLTVKVASTAPSFTQGLKDMEGVKDQNVSFTVKIAGTPKPSAKWTKDGAELTIDGKRVKTVEEASDSLTLIIEKLVEDDAGTYGCEIRNESGKETTSSKLRVKVKPNFTQSLSDKTVKSGTSDVDFTAKIEGNPKPNVKWYIGEMEITETSNNYKIISNVDAGTYTLKLKSATADVAGKYTCEASSDLGKATSSGILTVSEDRKVSPPAFTQGMKDVEVDEGQEVSFNVKIGGEPKPSVKWDKDGAELTIDGKHIKKIEEASDSLTIIIDKAAKTDAGKYTCVISNECGTESSSGKMTVKAKPVFKEKLKDLEAKEGDANIELAVQVEGSPCPKIKWSVDEKEITSNDKYKITGDDATGSYKLLIKKASSDVSGKYTCEASNSSGKADTSAAFNVLLKPKIIEGLKDVDVNEGETVQLTVKVTGSPAPDVKWFRNGEEVSAAATIKIFRKETETCILEIEKITISMSGEYEFRCTNKIGEASTKGKVNISSKPVFEKGLKDAETQASQDATFEVKVKGQPSPKISWFKDTKEISESEHYKISSKDTTHTLIIKNTQVEDGTTYVCKAKNSAGEVSESAKLTVKVDDTYPPKFINRLNDQVIVVGDAGRLQVKIAGKPKPEVVWYKNEDQLSDSDRIKITIEEDVYSVTLKDLALGDSARYSCQATNEKGTESDDCVLTVKDPVAPKIDGMKDIEIGLKSTAKFELRITGFPIPDVKWLKDGQPIKGADNIMMSAEKETHQYSLTVTNLTEENVGVYSCVASNCAGEVKSDGKLSVGAEAPAFTKKMIGKRTKRGDNVKLEVSVSGYPDPTITWLRNDAPVVFDDHIKVTKKEDTHVLEIMGMKSSDIGSYCCKATNSAGEVSCTASLSMEAVAPTIDQELPKFSEVPEGAQLKLEAKIDGQPAPEIKWLKNGKELKPDDRIKMETTPDGLARLIINDATPEDIGKYALIANNDKGEASSRSQVNVQSKNIQSAPSFVKNLEDLEVLVGKPAILEAKVIGMPKPEFSWFKNGEKIESSPHAQITDKADFSSKLTIDHATADDIGEYMVKAVNSVGEASSSAKIGVKGKKPELTEELKPVQFTEGQPGKLQIKVSGEPKPTITWLKNGKNLFPGSLAKATEQPDGIFALEFEKVKPEDAGRYEAIISNDLGKERTEAPVIVIPAPVEEKKRPQQKKPSFVQPLMPLLITQGKPARLEAKISTDPLPVSISWLKDGKILEPNTHYTMIEEEDGTIALLIDKAVPSDAGKFMASLFDGIMDTTSEAKVTVVPELIEAPGKKPEFLKGLQPGEIMEGQTLTLEAIVSSEPKATIKWLKDGTEILPSEKVTMTEKPDGTVILVMKNVTPDDAGKYVVCAINDEGKTRSAAQVEVTGRPVKKPEIMEELKPATFLEGQPGKLNAKVDGEPKPEVKWMKDGEEVKPSHRIKLTKEPDGNVAVVIDKVKPEDAGKYTVIAANEEGEIRSAAPVTVNQPPIFATPLEPVDAVEDYPNKLEIKLTGEPVPEVQWLKDGKEINPDGDHIKSIQHPDGTIALVFDKCKPEDSGKYTCVAKNPFGETSTSGEVSVGDKEFKSEPHSPPMFITPLSDVSVKEGEPMKFEATVQGNPLPDVIWLLDDQPISASENILPSFTGKKVSLDIKHSNPQHAGVFECQLKSTIGDGTSKATAKVTPLKAPVFAQRLADMDAPTSEPMKLTCRVEGIPDPEISWYYNGNLIEPGLKYTMLREGEVCSLVIPYPRIRDSGTYECKAKNKVGQDSCKASINVSDTAVKGEPPTFLKKLRACEVLQGMSAKFTACVTGIPKPDIKWFKNGEQLEMSSRHTVEQEPNGILRLIIYGVKPSDIGDYRCSISNRYGSDTCTAELILGDVDDKRIPKPVGDQADADRNKKTAPPPPLPHQPYILRMDDQNLTLAWRPSVPTFPRMPVTYQIETCRYPDGDWSVYKSGIKDSTCDIRDLVPTQDYRFRVRVENKHGVSDPSPYVTALRSQIRPSTPGDHKPKDYEVEHFPLDKHAAAPRFLRQEEETIYGIRGQPVRIEFWVYGHPQPSVTWYFNGEKVDTTKYDFLEDRNGQVMIFITRMTETDVGSYMCHAVNEHGEARQKVNLLIAEPPVFSKRLQEQTVMIRGGGKLVGHVVGLPYPKIKWFKDWHPIYDSNRIKITWEAPDKCVLTLNSSILKDAGLYTCSASNIAGKASSSAMLTVEESETEYNLLTYSRPRVVKPSGKLFEDFYDIGDELGRGTQGITYHSVERKTGKSFGTKVMHGTGKMRDFMDAEMDIMNQLCHPRLVRLWDAFETKSSLTLVTDLCGGSELIPSILQRGKFTESDVAHIIKQVLEGLDHMHRKNIAHLGLNVGDILMSRVNSDNLQISDFGLATRLYSGREFIQEYGQPEFVAPEIANKQPVTLAADLWSVGIIAYLLLTGSSPFLGENDRETLKKAQQGKVDFYHDNYVVLSDEAKDFISKLLVIDPSNRLDVKAALDHPWLSYAEVPGKCDELESIENLKDYYKKWKNWYANASCKTFYRRRPLDSCLTHPSRMIYPPDEDYTPPSTPDRDLERTHIKPAAYDDTFKQKISREPIDIRSESQYQSGPDTFLLPLRDSNFPVRIRQYLRVGATRSPILVRHLQEKHWGDCEVAVKERRKFMEIMDEEINDEKRGLSGSVPMRLQREVGTYGSGHEHIESWVHRKKSGVKMPPGTPPYFREKIKDVVIREDDEVVFRCFAVGEPKPLYSWFRNEGILIESSRIMVKNLPDGHCELHLRPGKAYDVGVYKCVARNIHGVAVCRARLKIGDVPGKPEPPQIIQASDREIYVTWNPPKFEGNSTTVGYALEYKKTDEENWSRVANNITHDFFLVHDLDLGSTYIFRLRAMNRFGWGDFSLPSEPCNTLPERSPKIKISKAQKYQQELTEKGQQLILNGFEIADLDYNIEDTTIPITEGNPLELYNFVSEISRGRFSVVVKVWVKKLNTTLMAKVLQKTPQTQAAVQREYDILKTLRHERIACLEDASSDQNSLILVMEKLSGIDVLTYLSSRSQYTEETVSKIIHQVLDAVEYLHFRNICYLELQPDNVVLVDQHYPEIKLVDFGVSQFVPPGGGKVDVKGTLEYLAPEIIKEEDASTASDIWGVGVLTYILLSGVAPFLGETDQDTKTNITFVRYHFDNLYKEVTQEATRFLMHVFKRTPQKRPTVEECLENKWLLPSEFMLRKREHAIFQSHRIREFSDNFHVKKRASTPSSLLDMFGMSFSRSVSLETDTFEEL